MRSFLIASGFAGLSFALACSGGGGGSSSSSSGGGPDGGTTADGGSSGTVVGPDGGPVVGGPGALPVTTFLFVSKLSANQDILMAFDGTTGQTRVVTDLKEAPTDEGWSLGGYSLSLDRTRIAAATLYGPTKEDNDTKIATRRIWSFAPDGSDFRRLTPVFPNNGGGKTNFTIEIRNPAFSKDGATVMFNYGEYWYEGTSLKGGSGVWSAPADGSKAAAPFRQPNPCSVADPSTDPSTGNVAIINYVCIPGQGKDGIYLYAPDGTGTPETLIESSYATIDVSLEPPRWAADGAGFTYIGQTQVDIGGTNTVVRGLFIFDMETRKSTPVVLPQTADTRVIDAAPAPDASAIVYCLQEGEATNLHLIDLTKTPATDTPITNDGKSCHPVW